MYQRGSASGHENASAVLAVLSEASSITIGSLSRNGSALEGVWPGYLHSCDPCRVSGVFDVRLADAKRRMREWWYIEGTFARIRRVLRQASVVIPAATSVWQGFRQTSSSSPV